SVYALFFFSSSRRHTRSKRDWSSDVCSSDLRQFHRGGEKLHLLGGQLRLFVLRVLQVVDEDRLVAQKGNQPHDLVQSHLKIFRRSEERRVGTESSTRWSTGGR